MAESINSLYKIKTPTRTTCPMEPEGNENAPEGDKNSSLPSQNSRGQERNTSEESVFTPRNNLIRSPTESENITHSRGKIHGKEKEERGRKREIISSEEIWRESWKEILGNF